MQKAPKNTERTHVHAPRCWNIQIPRTARITVAEDPAAGTVYPPVQKFRRQEVFSISFWPTPCERVLKLPFQ